MPINGIKYQWIKFGILLTIFWMIATTSSAQISGYTNRFKAHINASEVSGSTSLSNFPVLVNLTNNNLRHTSSGGQVQNINGYDIAFTSANGTTLLSHQIEEYNPTTGELTFWVRFPSLSAITDTQFYIYFGNLAVSSNPSNTNVWDSNYKMVLHLNETGTAPLTIFDAAGEGTNGSDNGTVSVTGQIAGGRNFNGNNDRIVIADNGVSPLDISGNITISFWLNIANRNNGPDILTKGDYLNGYSIWTNNLGAIQFQINNDPLSSSNGELNNGTWTYLSFTRASNGNRVMYKNGSSIASDNSNESFNVDDEDVYLSTASFWPFRGFMDEVRISNITRSADWIATEFNNQNNPGNFIDLENAEPVLNNIETSALSFNSGDAPKTITSTITTYDGDDINLEFARISITSNFQSSEDVLAFTNQLGISGSWDSFNGVLTLTGTSSIANYQTALQAVTYENTNPAPSELTRTISFTVNDGEDNSNTETRNIEVTKVNIGPILSLIETDDLVYFAGAGQKIISYSISLTDPDDINIDSAFVEITSGYLAIEDTLEFADMFGITGSWDDLSGRLTLSGTTTPANYRAALRTITYQNTSISPTMIDRTISFTANDGSSNGNTISRTVTYPTEITELASYKATGVFHYDAQDADGDGNALTNQPANGALGTWGDRSNDVGASTTDLSATNGTASNQPNLNSSNFGGRSGLEFDGTDDNLSPPNNNLVNLTNYTEKSFALVFRTGTDVSGLQIIYEQGGGTRGYQLSIKEGNLYAYVWNNSEWGGSNQDKSINLGSIAPNNSYIVIASHDATDALLINRVWEANVNGGSITTLTNVDEQRPHSGGAEIGESDGTLDPVTEGGTSGSTNFEGYIGEFISWNNALSSDDFTNIYAFLSEKWFNIPPVLTGIELTDLSFNEGDPALSITSSISISDEDNTTLDSAKVSISSGFDNSEDILTYPAPIGGVIGSYNSSTGELLLTGSANLSTYESVLQSITYQNTDGVSPSTTTRTISFEVYDWDDVSNIETRNIEIIPANAAPVLFSIESSTLNFTEGDAPISVTSSLSPTDSDNAEFTGATVAFTDNYFLGEDILAFTDQLGIIGSFNSMTGVLSLSGTSASFNYQTALRAVTFENISTDPVTALNREVSFRVFDGIDSSNILKREISVTALNTPPSLSEIETSGLFYAAGDTVIVTETIEVTDPDNNNIASATIQISSGYNSAEDSLIFDDIFGITDSWNDGTGTLSLTGPATKTDFEAALQTVTYTNTASTPTDSPRQISFTVSDGTDNSNTVIRNVSFSIPKAVSGLVLWLEADEGTYTNTGCTTPATSSLDNVGCWEDQSGNGNNFISTGSSAPVLQTSVGSINTQNAIEFPGGGSNVRLEDTDAETQYLNGLFGFTIFFVIESDVTNTDRGFWTTTVPSGSTTDRYFSLRYDATGNNGGGTNVITAGMRDQQPAFTLESFEQAQTTSGQIVMLKWTSEDNYEMYVDGVLSNPSYSLLVPTGSLANITTAIIGQGPLDNNTSWDGLIAEVILYGQEIDLVDQETIEDYLSNKYSVPIRSLTPATGGEAISADDANVTYTTLSGPRVQESFVGEFSTGTYIFKVPTGFEWDVTGADPTATVTAAFGGTTDLSISYTSRSTSQITFTITTASTTDPAEITFSGFRVRPTTGTLPNQGNITNIGTTGLGGSTNYGRLTMVSGTQIAMEYAQQPGTSNVNSAVNPAPRIQLIDQYGNPVEGSRIDVTMTLNQVSGTGVLSGSSTTLEQTNLFGIAEFDNLIVDDTGTYSLMASSTGLADTTSSDFDVVVLGQLTGFKVERVPSGNISDKLAGQSFNIKITAIDGTQSTVTAFTGTVSLTSNCTLATGGGTTASFTAGVLNSKTVSIANVGNCSITATNSSGAETGTSNTFTVTPGAASVTITTITANPTVISNNGFSTSTITVQAKDAQGNNLTSGGASVLLSTTDGALSSVTDNSNGTYTATLTSSIVEGTATITGTLNGTPIVDNAAVTFANFDAQWQSQIGPVSSARDWNDPTNWSSGLVPLASHKVLIPANPSVGNELPVVTSTNTTVAQISIENNATVTVSGGINFVVTGETSGAGEVLGSNSDSLTVGGTLDISDAPIGYVLLNGALKQIVSSPNSFTNLILNNPNGADFAGDLIVSDSLKLINGTLFLPSGSNLIANSKEYDTGTIRMQRIINGDIGWRIISSPFNTTYGDLLDGTLTQGYAGAFYSTGSNPGDTLQPNVLTYLENYDGTDNQRYRAPTNASQSVNQGQGIFVFVFDNIPADPLYNDALPDTLDTSGQEWDGDGTEVDFGVTYTTSADSGWNLVGNPFAASIDWDDTPNWTKTNIESTIYIWDPASNGGEGEYLTWNGITGTLPNSGLIAPFQGFWVKANGPGPVLKVNKEAKTTGGTFIRKQMAKSVADTLNTETGDEIIPRIQFGVISDIGRSKQTDIMFSETASKGKDLLDAYRLLPLSSSHIELHTLLENGTEMAINNLPVSFNSRYFIPLHFEAYENGFPYSGTFTMKWGDLRGIPDDWLITLIDNETGKQINILDELSYSFTHTTQSKLKRNTNPLNPNLRLKSKSSTQSTRFTLKISTEQIEADIPEAIYLSQNYPNPFNPSTTIEFGLNEAAIVELQVFDILGRKVQTLINNRLEPGRHSAVFQANALASGVYIFRLQANGKVFIKKMTFIK